MTATDGFNHVENRYPFGRRKNLMDGKIEGSMNIILTFALFFL
jgi:hypothetical protein